MRRIRGRRRVLRIDVLLSALWTTVLAAASTGCGSGDDARDDGAVAVTVTVTRPAAPVPASAAAPPPPPAPAPLAIALVDRAFDAGLVAASRTEGETLVLSIDRLTVAGLDDAALASVGAPVEPDQGERFGNQRVALYDVAVSPDALFVVTTCTRGPAGVDTHSQPLSAAEFVASVPVDAPVLITYAAGLLSRAEVNPRC